MLGYEILEHFIVKGTSMMQIFVKNRDESTSDKIKDFFYIQCTQTEYTSEKVAL